MQETKFKDAIRYYDPIVKRLQESLVDVTAIVLANLCVSYIMTSQVCTVMICILFSDFHYQDFLLIVDVVIIVNLIHFSISTSTSVSLSVYLSQEWGGRRAHAAYRKGGGASRFHRARQAVLPSLYRKSRYRTRIETSNKSIWKFFHWKFLQLPVLTLRWQVLFHFAITVIGTLYCAKGNFEFGISRIIKVKRNFFLHT